MDKLVTAMVMIAIVVIIIALVALPIWALWCWVLPQLWPTGPAALIQPSYWLFVGALILFRLMFGGSSGSTK